MYTFMKNLRTREGLLADAPALLASLAVAELFYKFHSFALECVCFLATWYAIGWVLSRVAALVPARQSAAE